MKKNLFGIISCLLIPSVFSFAQLKESPIRIALTKASPNYINWISKGDSSVIVVDLNNLKPAEAIQKLHDCAGLILTGGGDIDPALYMTGEKDKEECKDIDRNRDLLEKTMIDEALAMKMPILGICRGEQMLNVGMGGTLITDIPSYMKIKNLKKNPSPADMTGPETAVPTDPGPIKKDTSDVTHQCDDYLHCFHTVRLDPSSLLRSIIGCDTGFVTTNHHQAVQMLGKGLRKNARTADGIIEGIEWNDAREKSFMLGVQWHPERMETSSAFSGKLLLRFLAEVNKYAATLKNVR